MAVKTKIKAIQTRYNGYKFRSRLEARWAVFFDAMGIEWEYELEGYDLGGDGYYLPDFFIKEAKDASQRFLNSGYWVEIKSIQPTFYEMRKLQTLAVHTKHHGIFLYGSIDKPKVINCNNEGFVKKATLRWPSNPLADSIAFCVLIGKRWSPDHIVAALNVAKSARFEHGETPEI